MLSIESRDRNEPPFVLSTTHDSRWRKLKKHALPLPLNMMPGVKSPPPQGRRSAAGIAMVVVVTWAIGSLVALIVTLAAMEIDHASTAEAGRANLHALWPFWLASGSGWTSLTALWVLLARRASSGPSPRAGRVVALVVAVALLSRLAVLVAHQATLSDDIHRYVFDGRTLARGVNPYLDRPEDRLDAEERWPGERAVAALINNPQMHTIYLPTTQWVFAATGLVIPDAWSEPDLPATAFRAVFAGLDLAVIGGLLVALVRRGRSPWWAALYAWHPLALTEIAGSGHQESLGLALLVGALILGTHAPRRTWRWTGVLALATLVKPIVLPVAAFILKGQRWQAWAASVLIGGVVCLAVAGPLWLSHEGEPLANLAETTQRFRLKWAHFGSAYEPLLWTIEKLRPAWSNDRQEVLARRICLAAVAAVIVGVWWRGPADVWARSRMILLAMVLLSPAAHPWYLLWALALVPMAPSTAVWICSLTLPWGYAAWSYVSRDGMLEWGVSPWLLVAAYAPVYAALAVESGLRWRPLADRPPFSRG
jgi:hypothetical protein